MNVMGQFQTTSANQQIVTSIESGQHLDTNESSGVGRLFRFHDFS
jgi:hypothetical protein